MKKTERKSIKVTALCLEEEFKKWGEHSTNSRRLHDVKAKRYTPHFDVQKPGRFFDCKTKTRNSHMLHNGRLIATYIIVRFM